MDTNEGLKRTVRFVVSERTPKRSWAEAMAAPGGFTWRSYSSKHVLEDHRRINGRPDLLAALMQRREVRLAQFGVR